MTDTRAVMAHQGHARIGRKIINHDSGGYGVCAWGECDRDANSLHQVRTHEHPQLWRHDGRTYTRAALCELVNAAGGEVGRHVWYAFCTERHKLYWVNATGTHAHESLARTGRAWGNLPVGDRGTLR